MKCYLQETQKYLLSEIHSITAVKKEKFFPWSPNPLFSPKKNTVKVREDFPVSL